MDFKDFPPIGGLMVSKMISEEGVQPGFMYREKITRDEDSGWRIFSGLESQEYLDDPENVGIYDPATILEIDPSIAELLLTGVGSVYERETESAGWNKVKDFALEDDYITTHTLTDDWTFEINNLFGRREEEDGELLYTTGDKSVRLAIWLEEGKSKSEIYAEQKEIIETRDQSEAKTLDRYDFSDSDVFRVGYLIKEMDGDKEYSVIYGFNIIDGEVLLSVFYFDDEVDLDWAIGVWKSMKAKS
jgi:hypothetical protein